MLIINHCVDTFKAEHNDNVNIYELNYKELASLLQWTESGFLHKSPTERQQALISMGVELLEVHDKGKNATYIVRISSELWRMSIITSMNFSKEGARYINMHLSGEDILNDDNSLLVRFHTELHNQIAQEYNLDQKQKQAMERNCKKIKAFLLAHGYTHKSSTRSHRGKKKDASEWMVGYEAIKLHTEAVPSWIQLYSKHNNEKIVMSAKAREKEKRELRWDLMDRYDLHAYGVAYKTELQQSRLIDDINRIRIEFHETKDYARVMKDLKERQAQYLVEDAEQARPSRELTSEEMDDALFGTEE